jgi:hypothetical protein
MKHNLSMATGIVVGILAGCATSPSATPMVGPPMSGNNDTCLKETGSRILPDGSACAATGRSYSSEDISRTGATTSAGALQLLDPSITVRH